jgi:hypothetical protein
VAEVRDLFNEYAEKMYPEAFGGDGGGDDEGDGEVDIEKEIQAELAELKKPTMKQLFTHVRVNLQCGKLLAVSAGQESQADGCEQSCFSRRLRRLYPQIWSNESARTPCRIQPASPHDTRRG